MVIDPDERASVPAGHRATHLLEVAADHVRVRVGSLRTGEHVAIVGTSGAGKSTVLGVLLGWHLPAAGTVTVDGAPLCAVALRATTAWVDPAIQLWNRSLLDNLLYAATDDADLVRAMGHPVALVEGSSWLLKVTTPADLELAEALASVWDTKC